MKTLPLRIKQHSRNAQEVAEALAANSLFKTVNYPGLSDFPQADIANRQHLSGHGGVISFELAADFEQTCDFLRNVKLCTLVEHIGSVETLLTHPASMTHADVPQEQLSAVGLTPTLLRLSVGLEDPKDVLADILNAAEAVLRTTDPQGTEASDFAWKGDEVCQPAK